MVIVLTGEIGIGKTTVCQKFIDLARESHHSCGGVITYKSEEGDIIIRNIQTGEISVFASTRNVYRGPRTANYFFNPEGIDFGIRAIETGLKSDIVLVDELGPLELNGQGFTQVPDQIKTGKFKNCLLVIRKQLLSDFLPLLGIKPHVFEATLENRDKLAERIFVALKSIS